MERTRRGIVDKKNISKYSSKSGEELASWHEETQRLGEWGMMAPQFKKNTYLIEACEEEHKELFDIIINNDKEGVKNFIVRDTDMYGETMKNSFTNEQYKEKLKDMMEERKKEQLEMIEEQLQAGIDVQNGEGNTALIVASYVGSKEMVEELIKKNADINKKNQLGNTALMMACIAGNPEIAKKLVESGAEKETKNGKGETAIMLAKEFKREEIIKFLNEE